MGSSDGTTFGIQQVLEVDVIMGSCGRLSFRLASSGLLALSLAVTSCGVEPEIPDIFTVMYSLSVTGQSFVTELRYDNGGGRDILVSDPIDGWSVTFDILARDRIGASVEGTVQDGEIIITVTARSIGRPDIVRSDSCSESSGTATPCSLLIPDERL